MLVPAKVLEKSFAGGQLRILFLLEDGQQVVASRSGLDADMAEGSSVNIGWLDEHAVKVLDEGIYGDFGTSGEVTERQAAHE